MDDKYQLCACGDQKDAMEAAGRIFLKIRENQCPAWSFAIAFYLIGLAFKDAGDCWGHEYPDILQDTLIDTALDHKQRMTEIAAQAKEVNRYGR